MPDGAGPGRLIDRRAFLAAGTAGLSALGLRVSPAAPGRASTSGHGPVPGRLRQSVCRWPFAAIPLDRFCRAARDIGLEAVDLLYPDEWDTAHRHGLVVSTGYASRRPDFIARGFNDPALHETLIAELEEAIPKAAAAGVPNLIVMSGNRQAAGEDAGIAACSGGLRQIVPLAERHGVTLVLEMLNSRVDHAGYDADSTRYGLEVVERVGSPRFRLLYDIYHMQVMEGNVIATNRAHYDAIAHYHTAGVPGRHELDATQELNYPAIARAIADLEFEGFLAHEFIPTRDPLTSIREAAAVCRV
jgi:hydroxypyruvate isomerase